MRFPRLLEYRAAKRLVPNGATMQDSSLLLEFYASAKKSRTDPTSRLQLISFFFRTVEQEHIFGTSSAPEIPPVVFADLEDALRAGATIEGMPPQEITWLVRSVLRAKPHIAGDRPNIDRFLERHKTKYRPGCRGLLTARLSSQCEVKETVSRSMSPSSFFPQPRKRQRVQRSKGLSIIFRMQPTTKITCGIRQLF